MRAEQGCRIGGGVGRVGPVAGLRAYNYKNLSQIPFFTLLFVRIQFVCILW